MTDCAYCGASRAPRLDPFGGNPCCDECFNILIGGNPDDEPWRCGNAPEASDD